MTSATILIVEDNEPTRKLLAAYVSKNGHAVIEAIDGEDALSKLKSKSIDLILLDLQMQPLGGFRFMKKIIGTEFEVPTILVTGDPSSDILHQASDLGIVGVIQKPVKETLLIKHIDRVLKQKT